MIRRLLLSQAWVEDQWGQILVELALMSLVLFLMLAGLIDLGRAYFAYIAVTDAAAEGAAYGATFPDKIPTPGVIEYRAAGASGGLVSIAPENVQVDYDAEAITVTVTYTHTLLTPFMQTMMGEEIILRQRATKPILD